MALVSGFKVILKLIHYALMGQQKDMVIHKEWKTQLVARDQWLDLKLSMLKRLVLV